MKLITTLDRTKTFLKLNDKEDAERDFLIEEILIPIVTEFVIGYTGVDFEKEGRSFPVAYEVVAFRLINYHLTVTDGDVISESMGNYSVTYGQNGMYPENLLKGLHRRMRTPSTRIRGRQPKGRGSYEDCESY
ncbi:hypothetical protein COI97_16055 [Bacillus cereus]|nr:hypothetical protein COI97_16055 [Bacillus cereus]